MTTLDFRIKVNPLGFPLILMIQYASYDKGNAIGFLVLLIGITIMKTLVKEWKKF